MSGWKKSLVALGLMLGLLLALVWFFPARWAFALAAPRVQGMQLRDVSGLIWRGRIGGLSAQGDSLGALQWRLSRRLLLGQLQLHLHLAGPVAELTVDVSRAGRDLVLQQLSGDIRLSRLPRAPLTSLGVPQGVLMLKVRQATLLGSWPMTLAANAQWRTASVQTSHGAIALGRIDVTASGSNGVIDADLRDAGDGPLHVAGKLQLSPLGWRVTATLQPRTDDPALRQWLATLGRPDAQGVVHIQRGAGLGAVPPTSGVAR